MNRKKYGWGGVSKVCVAKTVVKSIGIGKIKCLEGVTKGNDKGRIRLIGVGRVKKETESVWCCCATSDKGDRPTRQPTAGQTMTDLEQSCSRLTPRSPAKDKDEDIAPD